MAGGNPGRTLHKKMNQQSLNSHQVALEKPSNYINTNTDLDEFLQGELCTGEVQNGKGTILIGQQSIEKP